MMDLADRIQENATEIAVLEARDSGGLVTAHDRRRFHGRAADPQPRARRPDGFPLGASMPDAGNPMFPSRHYVRREPIGVCVGIVPWNFPFTMGDLEGHHGRADGQQRDTEAGERHAAVGIGAGARGRAIARARRASSTSSRVAVASSAACCARIPRSTRSRSPARPRSARRSCRWLRKTVKKVTLELGGKSANIVLPDADIDSAVDGAILASFLHSGQVCESGTRLLLPDSLYDHFLQQAERARRADQGRLSAGSEDQDGPAREQEAARDRRRTTCASAATRARRSSTGGHEVEVEGFEKGCYYAPTIFGDVKNGSRIAQEEIFGPVLSVIRYQRRRRGDRDRQRLAVRPRRRRVVARHRARRARRRAESAPARCGSTTTTCSAISRRSAATSRAASAASSACGASRSTPSSSTSTSASEGHPALRAGEPPAGQLSAHDRVRVGGSDQAHDRRGPRRRRGRPGLATRHRSACC